MTRKCKNCDWQGKDSEVMNVLNHCPVCGCNTEDIGVDKKESFDLDGDGDFDKDDVRIAARVLAKGKTLKKKGKKK